jgi:hypothetical protein
MSDSRSSYGEPVDEPKDVVDHDVVSRAHEGLAEAEAARREAEAADTPAHEPESAAGDRTAAEQRVEPVSQERAEPVSQERVEPDGVPWYERDDVPLDDEPAVTASEPAAERESSYAPAAWTTGAPQASEPAYTAPEPTYTAPEPAYAPEPSYAAGAAGAAAATAPAAQPIFVQAPEAPRARGNRGAAGAIGLLAALVFAVLFLAAWLGLELLYDGGITLAEVPQAALAALTTWTLWVPVVAFYIGFWLLGAFINRGRWGHWVVWGILVGLVAYAGNLLGELFQAPFWMLTAREGAALVEEQLLAPLSIVAFVLGRELTIWFGAWVAARGRRATELNDEAQREYERTLEAGPQLRQG